MIHTNSITDSKTVYGSGKIQKDVSVYNSIIAGYRQAGYSQIINENSFKGYIIHVITTMTPDELKIGDVIIAFNGVRFTEAKTYNEFAYECSKLTYDDNAKYSITVIRNNEEQKFQNSHTNISFLVDDFVIFADSTTTVEAGDLSSSKYSLDLKGIRCMQYDDEIQQRFMQAKGKVKSYIVEQDEKYNMMIPNKDYIEELNENQKVVLFNNCLVNCDLENIDFLSYANKLISVLDLNFNTSIYCDNETESKILLNVSLDNYTDFENDRISYFIDSTNKTIYDSSNELTLKGKNSSKK